MISRTIWLVAGAMAALLFTALPAQAGGGFSITREEWQLIMRLVNFGIIVIIFMKYGKSPLMRLLRARREHVAATIQEVEDAEAAAIEKRQEQQVLLDQLEEEAERIKAYYRQIGEEEKERIIEDARAQAQRLLDDAREASQGEFEAARKRFRQEVVDVAVALAEERITKKISKDDHQKLIEAYLQGLQQAHQSVAG